VRKIHSFQFALALSLALGISYSAAAGGPVWAINKSRLGVVQPCGNLLGQKVQDQHGKKVGTIADFLVDLKTGQVIFMMVDAGNDKELTPVPATTYVHFSRNIITVDFDRDLFSKAPHVSKANALCALEPERRGATFRHFQKTEPELTLEHPDQFASALNLRNLEFASSSEGQVGQVKDVIMDLSQGILVYLIIDPATGVGSAADLYLVPPVAVTPVGLRLTVAMDKAKFIAGPRFQKEYWADLSSATLAGEVSTHYGLVLGAAPAPQKPATATPVRSDRDINQAIVLELARQAHGSGSQKLAVVTVNGRVTITGTVKNQEEKHAIIAAAERVAGKGNVEDRLETGGKNQTAKL
jgi:sporulation protein YlmC with PRC-barrel domain